MTYFEKEFDELLDVRTDLQIFWIIDSRITENPVSSVDNYVLRLSSVVSFYVSVKMMEFDSICIVTFIIKIKVVLSIFGSVGIISVKDMKSDRA